MVEIETFSAITVLNAIKSNYGSAMAIDIKSKVIVEASDKYQILTEPAQDTSLIENCFDLLSESYGPFTENISIRSSTPLPPQRGLKTSSSISTATIAAILKFFTLQISTEEIIDLSADASINVGVSITGAIDDAFASYCGGLSITNTVMNQLHRLTNPTIQKEVILLVSQKENPKKVVKELLEVDFKSDLSYAEDQLMKGDIEGTIKENTRVYSQYLLSDPSIINELKSHFSIVGLNGAGPSLFALMDNKMEQKELEMISESYPEYQFIPTTLVPILRPLR